MGSDEFDQPLLSSPLVSGSATTAPRILDRDGTFSQSRGRWSVENAPASGQGFGSARQRRAAGAAASALAEGGGGAAVARATGSGAVPFGVAHPPPPPRPPSNGGSGCCFKSGDQPTLTRRCWDDWFHSLSYTPTCILMLGVFVAYFVTIMIFAGLYLAVNKVGEHWEPAGTGGGGGLAMGAETGDVEVASFCGMDINNHMEALYFSLSTMATIGYGTSDYYFGDCWTPFILVLLQVFSAIVFSSLAIGLLFQRMSRGQKRGRTIVFSDVAVIRKVRGRWYWMFRVAELRKQHIIGAKVQVFCVRHERCPVAMAGGEGGSNENGGNNVVELETAHFVSHALPLLNGSKSTGSSGGANANEEAPHSEGSYEKNILMGLPDVVVHCMDSLSPLMPPRPVWYDAEGVPHGGGTPPPSAASEVPTESTTEDGSSSLLAADLEEGAPVPPSPSSSLLSPSSTNQPTQEEITHFLLDRRAEIIVFIEGTCEVTGMTLQARHSYRVEDVAFHQTFAPCVFPAGSGALVATGGRQWNPFAAKSKAKVGDDAYSFQGNAALEIDFSQFHDLLPAPYDSMSCPYIPSSSLRRW